MKLPVFFHTPKNAGTYVCDVLWFSALYHLKTGRIFTRSIKKIHIKAKDGREKFHIIVYNFPEDYFDRVIFTPIDKVTVSCDLDLFLSYRDKRRDENIKIYAAVINAAGFRSSDKFCNLIKQMTGQDLKKFIVLRDPLDRECSLFRYLKSERSKHERTHNSIKEESISDYLSSNRVADSWLIRELLNMQDNEIITEDHYNACIKILDEFDVGIIENVDLLIDKVLMECYSYNANDVFIFLKNINPNRFNVNKNSSEKFTLNIDEGAVNKFKERAKYDFMLYDHYSNKRKN